MDICGELRFSNFSVTLSKMFISNYITIVEKAMPSLLKTDLRSVIFVLTNLVSPLASSRRF